ncbi:hypothetical protein LRR18_09330 [Mangrovimonas sp. AS39]|uniref:hypothetical protein n=1 Tax=Mangrovimonas futianensis TaxID=2895523 RepID=UPI00141F26F0|nr:hypothetical protein [Mangrovimonas futianensis]MCF1191787.1 hypothetical protein [Mangrovimonas futianensis]MCF1195325.1 hypothetical protein [Mangrovimonas futianensis]NIK91788.1 hypothetical protein [Mangrovimonas sp. CR14]
MRTNNAKVRNVIVSVYFILIVVGILLAVVFKAFSDLSKNPLITSLVITVVFSLIFFLFHFISKYFEYDSDGMKVVITNKGLLLADHFNYREKTVDFDKRQLAGFKFRNFIFYKTLVVYLKSDRGNHKSESFNVTLVARKKRKYIKQSLSKIIKLNAKALESEKN